MIAITLPEMERRIAEAADKICRRQFRVRYLEGQITQAKGGFAQNGLLLRCKVFQGEEELAEMQLFGCTLPVAEWVTLNWTPEEGWAFPHD